MLHTLRSALLPVLILGVSSALTGCKTNCDSTEQGSRCVSESAVGYKGTAIVQEVAWTAGQALRVGVAGGNVRYGDATTSITVNVHGVTTIAGCTDVNKVCVQFTPINADTQERREEATRQMKQVSNGGNLSTTIVNDATQGVVIEVKRDTANSATFNSSLSALVDVLIPAGFDGDIIAGTNNIGDVVIKGVRRGLKVNVDNGNVLVQLGAVIAIRGGERTVTALDGDITFQVPAASLVSVQAQANADDPTLQTVELRGATAGWKPELANTIHSATFSNILGGGDGNWSLKALSGAIAIDLF